MGRHLSTRSGGRLSARLLPALVVCGGLALTGAVGAFGLSRLQTTPETALALWPWRAGPHLHLGQAALATKDEAGALSQARQALEHDPLSVRAYSMLGQAAVVRGDTARADALMAAAARRSLRDAPSQTWIFARALERGDFPASLAAYDVLMRRRPDLAERLSPPVFAAADGLGEARAALAARLALNPGWRPSFLAAYSRASAQPAAIHALLSRLRTTAAPPTDAEMRVYLDRLLRDRAYVAAYVAWAGHQPGAAAEAGAGVSDASFEQEGLLLAPFGWTLTTGDGASAQRAPLPDSDGFGLQATVSGGLARRTIAEQMMVLPRGEYRLSGRVWLEGGDPDGRLVWTVQCEGGPRLLLASVEAPKGAAGAWTSFEAAVVVPGDCPAQRLRLEARPGASLAQVSMVFDDIDLVRSGGGARPDGAAASDPSVDAGRGAGMTR